MCFSDLRACFKDGLLTCCLLDTKKGKILLMAYPERNSLYLYMPCLCLFLFAIPVQAQDGYWGSVELGYTEDFHDIYFNDANHGWIVGQNGLILYTENGGDSASDWHAAQIIPTTEDIYKVYFMDNFLGWAVGGNGVVLSTVDGGLTWDSASSVSTSSTLMSVFFLGSQTGWLASASMSTAGYRTTNGGTDWNPILSLDGQGRDLIFSDASNGWMVTISGSSPGIVYGTSSGGASWIDLVSSPSTLYALALDSDQQVWVVGGNGEIRRSGNSWSPVNIGTADLHDISFVPGNSDVAWAVGQAGAIYHTVNAGAQWGDEKFVVQDLEAVTATDNSRAWAVGTGGTYLIFRQCITDDNCSGVLQDCMDYGKCDPATHLCGVEAVNGTACDDGLYCTEGDSCQSGTCQAGTARDCSAMSDECNTGQCDEQADACVAQPVVNGTACDDGLYCTEGDSCQSGTCQPGTARDCSAMGDECNTGQCDEQADACVAQPVADGMACDDNSLCTDGDHCEHGLCVGATETDCSYMDDPPCFVGWCDPDANTCSSVPDPGAPCDDGLLCTEGDSCNEQGQCHGTTRNCPDCQLCLESAGVCVADAQAQGQDCGNPEGCRGVCDDAGNCVVEAWCGQAVDGCEELDPIEYFQPGACRLGEDFVEMKVDSLGFMGQGRFTPIRIALDNVAALALENVLVRVLPSDNSVFAGDSVVLESATVLDPSMEVTRIPVSGGTSLILHLERQPGARAPEGLALELLMNGHGSRDSAFQVDAWAPCASSHEDTGCHWDNSPEGVHDLPPFPGLMENYGFQRISSTGTWNLSGQKISQDSGEDSAFVGCSCNSQAARFSNLYLLLVIIVFRLSRRRLT